MKSDAEYTSSQLQLSSKQVGPLQPVNMLNSVNSRLEALPLCSGTNYHAFGTFIHVCISVHGSSYQQHFPALSPLQTLLVDKLVLETPLSVFKAIVVHSKSACSCDLCVLAQSSRSEMVSLLNLYPLSKCPDLTSTFINTHSPFSTTYPEYQNILLVISPSIGTRLQSNQSVMLCAD